MVEITTLCERLRAACSEDGTLSLFAGDLVNPNGPEAATKLEQLTTDLDTVVRALAEIRAAVEKRQLPITNQVYEIADEALSNIKREGVA